MNHTTPVISLRGTRLRETSKAVQFSIDEISGEVLSEPNVQWFPFSQVSKSTTGKTEGEDPLIVSEWIMKQKDLI